MTWYFTFGYGHEHECHYVKIEGTFDEARRRMCELFGDKWAFQYTENAFTKSVFFSKYKELRLEENNDDQ